MERAMDCPDADIFASFVAGGLSVAARRNVEQHTVDCPACTLLAAVAIETDDGVPVGQPLIAGRYLLCERIGSGGMGTVYQATDVHLGREVAVKRFSADVAFAGTHDEARAMARLCHPNVVPVYDSGTVGGDRFIVMQLVRGETLQTWLSRGPRPRAEIIRTFAAAAAGLTAAHDAGLVHRDFKPSNVLLGHARSVLVSDFGLAIGRGSTAGVVAGTPAYMAPEQRAGQPADARADQYSYCTALLVALTSDREWPRAELGQLLKQLPRGLRTVIARGLAPDPERRWPSMAVLRNKLLDTLRTRLRRVAVFSLGAACALLAAGAAAASDTAPICVPIAGSDACAPSQADLAVSAFSTARFAGVVGAHTLAQLDARLAHRPEAHQTVARLVAPGLNAEDAEIRLEVAVRYGAALAASGEFERASNVFRSTYDQAVDKKLPTAAVTAALGLARLSRTDRGEGERWIAAAETANAMAPTRHSLLRIAIVRAEALHHDGRCTEAIEGLTPWRESPTGSATTSVDLFTALGLASNCAHRPAEATDYLQSALAILDRSHPGPSLLRMATLHNLALAQMEARDFSSALELLDRANAEGDAAQATPAERWPHLAMKPTALAQLGRWPEARAAWQDVEGSHGAHRPTPEQLAWMSGNRCEAARKAAPEAEAIELCRLAWDRLMHLERVPPQSLLSVANAYSLLLTRLESEGAAVAVLREAISGIENAGLDAVELVMPLNNLARSLQNLGEPGEALAAYRRARRLARDLPADDRAKIVIAMNLGRLLRELGDDAESRELLREAQVALGESDKLPGAAEIIAGELAALGRGAERK